MGGANKELLADAGAASSIFLWLVSHALEWLPIVQFLSLTVSIIAGTFAALYHLGKLTENANKR